MHDGETHPSKGSWRGTLRERRRSISAAAAQQASELVCRRLCESPFWDNNHHVGLYLASDGEIDPAPIVSAAQAANKCLYLPVVEGRDMHFAAWRPGQLLRTNRFGIAQPITPIVDSHALELILLPVVGFASSGARLGMGGGFYDRFLEHALDSSNGPRSHPRLVGLAYECQRSDELEQLREPWDMPLEAIITEKRIYLAGHA